jgi:hypothetical protein
MLMLVPRRQAIRTLKGCATSVLLEAGAIRECDEHGGMIDLGDPQAHDRAFDIARQNPPPGISPKAAAVIIAEVLESIGDTCPSARIASPGGRVVETTGGASPGNCRPAAAGIR